MQRRLQQFAKLLDVEGAFQVSGIRASPPAPLDDAARRPIASRWLNDLCNVRIHVSEAHDLEQSLVSKQSLAPEQNLDARRRIL
jgi:hypothetical protein